MASSSKVVEMNSGWEPQFDTTLQKAYYDIMDKVGTGWNEFARCGLELDNNFIDEVTQEERNVRDRKYKMCQEWEKRKGRHASVEYIYSILNHFLFPKEYPELPQAKVQTKSSNDVAMASEYCLRVGDIIIDVRHATKPKDFLSTYSKTYGKGKVVIINNKEFSDFPRREDSEIDVMNMTRIWTELGCEVETHTDMTASGMIKCLDNLAKSKETFDYYVAVVMSYGKENDSILGCDNQIVAVRDIIELFDKENSPNLIGKPKLLFFNCCRGSKLDLKDLGDMKIRDITSRMHLEQKQLLNEAPKSTITGSTEGGTDRYDVPNYSDILVCYATMPGYVSIMNCRNGSWFINAVTNVFMKHAKQEHVLDMMVKVNEAMSEKNGLLYTSEKISAVKCMPQFECSLRKRLYL